MPVASVSPTLSGLLARIPAALPLARNSRRGRPPFSAPCGDDDDAGIPRAELDPETSRLLPAQQPRARIHKVRIQGRIASVRVVRVPSRVRARAPAAAPDQDGRVVLAPAAITTEAAPAAAATGERAKRRGHCLGAVGVRDLPPKSKSRGSGNHGNNDDDGASDSDDGNILRGDCQPRGYGIGGRGNIRRPTEVTYSDVQSVSSIRSRCHPAIPISREPDHLARSTGREGPTPAGGDVPGAAKKGWRRSFASVFRARP